MADIGSKRSSNVLDRQSRADGLFRDASKCQVTLTGASATFLEGSSFVINGLKAV
jgi:hypothetical protein